MQTIPWPDGVGLSWQHLGFDIDERHGFMAAPRNRSLSLAADEVGQYEEKLAQLTGLTTLEAIQDRIINQDLFDVLDWLPTAFVDLLFVDPPYNLTKCFHSTAFTARSVSDYEKWFETWFCKLIRVLKPTASVYICGEWHSSAAIHLVAAKHLRVRNRITWEREKGRGAKANWKNCSEDIWFCTCSDNYVFNVESVKLKRKVIAPYRDQSGTPKDWGRTEDGDYRHTHPSNVWSDITIPFWSMPENTEHPTQKPEKLLAKIILASSHPCDMVLDPFLGSGTSAVVAKKLGRRFVGVEIDRRYCCLAEKRLAMAAVDQDIQGYFDGVFWERNSAPVHRSHKTKRGQPESSPLFDTGAFEYHE